MLIYKATNTKNNKSYIGQTIHSLRHRKVQHKSRAKNGSKQPIHCAIRKYGFDSFSWEELYFCSNKKELDEAEIRLIASNNTFVPAGYNIAIGGASGDTLSNHPNKEEIIKKCEAARRPKLNILMRTDEYRKKISMAGKGRRHSEETKKKISQNHARPMLGKKLSEEAKRKIGKASSKNNLGRKLSKESRKKIAEAKKGQRCRHILSEAEALEIKISLKNKPNNLTYMHYYKELACKYNVSWHTIQAIKIGRLWKTL